MAFAEADNDANIWQQELSPEGAAASPAHPLVSSTTADMSASYSPDGSQIVLQSGRSGTPCVWKCAADGTRTWTVANPHAVAVGFEWLAALPLEQGTAVVGPGGTVTLTVHPSGLAVDLLLLTSGGRAVGAGLVAAC